MNRLACGLACALILASLTLLPNPTLAAGSSSSSSLREAELFGLKLTTRMVDVKAVIAGAFPGSKIQSEDLGGVMFFKAERDVGGLEEQLRVAYHATDRVARPYSIELWRTVNQPLEASTVSDIKAAMTAKYGKPRDAIRTEIDASAKDRLPKRAKTFLHRLLWAKSGKAMNEEDAGCMEIQNCGETYIYGEIWGFVVPGVAEEERAFYTSVNIVDTTVRAKVRAERGGTASKGGQSRF
jgi:hypothetical protein